jgi:hypothetical protein
MTKLKKIPIDDETYALLEEGAEQEGCTVDEYATKLMESWMEVVKADPTAAIELLKQQREAERKQQQ